MRTKPQNFMCIYLCLLFLLLFNNQIKSQKINVSTEGNYVYCYLKDISAYTQYIWDFGDGEVSKEISPSHTYDEDGYYTITFTGWNKDNNVEILTAFVEIGIVDCYADFNFSLTNAATNQVSFSFSGKADSNVNYSWAFDNGTISNEKDPIKTFSSPGRHNVFLMFSNESACFGMIYKEIIVGDPPCLADFSYIMDESNKVTCTNTSKGSNLSYFWEFGNGSYSSEKDPSTVFKSSGLYRINLIVFNDNASCIDYTEKVISVNGKGNDCEADFTFTVDNDFYNVNFYNLSKGKIEEYIWDYGDGVTENYFSEPIHTYQKAGKYNVCLTVINDKEISNMTCKEIIVGNDNKISCKANFNLINVNTANNEIKLVDNSIGTPNSYTWDMGDDKSLVTGQTNVTYQYDQPGYYLVSLKITTDDGCASKYYKLINVGMPDSTFEMYDYEEKEQAKKAGGYPIDFIGAGLGDNARLKWDFGDGSTCETSSSPTHVYQNTGTYTVCVTALDPITEDSSTYCQEVVVTGTKVDNASSNNVFTLYPNPAKDVIYLNIKSLNNPQIEVSINDLSGRIIKKEIVKSSELKNNWALNVSALPSGSYIIKVNAGMNLTYNKLLIKQ